MPVVPGHALRVVDADGDGARVPGRVAKRRARRGRLPPARGGLAQALQVPDGVEAAEPRVPGIVVRLPLERRHVVGTEHAVEPDVVPRLHAVDLVRHALVVERLGEVERRPLDVTEVPEREPARAPEAADRVRHVAEEREVALAQADRVRLGLDVRHRAVVRLDAVHDPADAADLGDRRIVRVQREPDASLLRDRDDDVHEVLPRVPELRGRHLTRPGRGRLAHVGEAEGRDPGAAASPPGDVGAHPVDRAHPVVTEHRDLELAHVADEGAEGVDLLVASGQAEAGPSIGG